MTKTITYRKLKTPKEQPDNPDVTFLKHYACGCGHTIYIADGGSRKGSMRVDMCQYCGSLNYYYL